MNTTPANLRSEALSILAELPLAFVQLHNAVTTSRRMSVVDINSKADKQKQHLLDDVRRVHREIAECFGEPRPANIGIQSATEDLTRWVSVWSWHPKASEWVAQLRHQLYVSQEITGHGEWVRVPDKVCPVCLKQGHLDTNPDTGEHRCERTRTQWTTDEYAEAVRLLIQTYQAGVA